MRKLINELVQLQMLLNAENEHRAANPKSVNRVLASSIRSLRQDVPADIRAHLDLLAGRVENIVVPIVDRSCSGCGIQLSTSLVQVVRHSDEIRTCPECARYLYAPSYQTALQKRVAARSGGSAIGIARFSSRELMIPHAKADDGPSALRLLCERLQTAGFIADAEPLRRAALQREELSSTALGNRLAFPHVRGARGGGLTMALATFPEGLSFGPAAEGPSELVFFIVIPDAVSAFYLKLLAGLSQAFAAAPARRRLLSAKTPDTLWKYLVHACQKTVA
jgi:mannitol/fructose-specific phosphotransferase system IIA component (Ntr-type)